MAIDRGVVADEATHSLSTFGLSVSNDHRLCHLTGALADAAVFVQKLFFGKMGIIVRSSTASKRFARARSLAPRRRRHRSYARIEYKFLRRAARERKGSAAVSQLDCNSKKPRIESTIDVDLDDHV